MVRQSTDPLNDSLTTNASLVAAEGKGLFGEPITLVLRCTDDGLEIFVVWNVFLDSSKVAIRFDDGEVRRNDRWILSNDNTATFYNYPPVSNYHVRFIQWLTDANRLVAQVKPYNDDPLTAVFDLTGIDQIGPQILETCS